MGNVFSNLFKKLLGTKKDIRILMVGLDYAGKTTILYRMKLGETLAMIPTIGFNVESIEFKNIRFTVWDLNGQERLRPLWKTYLEFENTTRSKGIIFVIDSSDRERLCDVYEEIWRLENELEDLVLLVLANKMDLPNSMSTEEMVLKLRLNLLKNKDWHIQETCALNGDGLQEGFNWLCEQLQDS